MMQWLLSQVKMIEIELILALEKNSILIYWKEADPEMTEVYVKDHTSNQIAFQVILYVFSPKERFDLRRPSHWKEKKNDTLSKKPSSLKEV